MEENPGPRHDRNLTPVSGFGEYLCGSRLWKGHAYWGSGPLPFPPLELPLLLFPLLPSLSLLSLGEGSLSRIARLPLLASLEPFATFQEFGWEFELLEFGSTWVRMFGCPWGSEVAWDASFKVTIIWCFAYAVFNSLWSDVDTMQWSSFSSLLTLPPVEEWPLRILWQVSSLLLRCSLLIEDPERMRSDCFLDCSGWP